VLANPSASLLAYLAAAHPRRLHRSDSSSLVLAELDQEQPSPGCARALHGLLMPRDGVFMTRGTDML